MKNKFKRAAAEGLKIPATIPADDAIELLKCEVDKSRPIPQHLKNKYKAADFIKEHIIIMDVKLPPIKR